MAPSGAAVRSPPFAVRGGRIVHRRPFVVRRSECLRHVVRGAFAVGRSECLRHAVRSPQSAVRENRMQAIFFARGQARIVGAPLIGRPLCATGGTRGRIVSLSLLQRYAASESEAVCTEKQPLSQLR